MSYDRDELKELSEAFDLELFLDAEGIRYKRGMGSRGPQLNLQTCPFCGGNKWKVFVNAENGLGNCFHGSCEKTFNKIGFVRAVLGGEEVRFGAPSSTCAGSRSRTAGGPGARSPPTSRWRSGSPSSRCPPHPDPRQAPGYLANRGIDLAPPRATSTCATATPASSPTPVRWHVPGSRTSAVAC
jgi:hypothetical protein